jgi:hypothetical protein
MGLTITFFIAVTAFGGIVFILWRKIPLLLELSDSPAGGSESAREVMARQAKRMVSSQKLKAAAAENFDKTFSRARTLASKTERHTGEWLNRLRKKQKEHKEEFTESYWDQLRKRSKSKK